MILIIADDSQGNWESALQRQLETQGKQVKSFAVNQLNIEPCTGCSNCSGRTYGRCILPDDMQQVLWEIVRCDTLILISPIKFGGVSYHIKKVMDRMSAVGDPRYHIKDGEMVKGMGGKCRNYHLIGLGESLSEQEQSAFRFLHTENRKIMNIEGKTFILDGHLDESRFGKIAKEICHASV